jgi:hypothetical protein
LQYLAHQIWKSSSEKPQNSARRLKIPNQKRGEMIKKALLMLVLLFFVNSVCLAQVAGNQIYGDQNYSNQNRLHEPNVSDGNLKTNENRFYSIDASVLLNVKPDAFMVVLGFDRLGSTSENSNSQVNLVFDDFSKDLLALGIAKEDIFVDFITQTTTIVDQTTRAFQTKKTISIRYKDRKLFEKIVGLAASKSIFDLVKVDYVVSNSEKIRADLFEQASQIIKAKHKKYADTFAITLIPKSLAVEKYDAFYPSERYKGYQKSFFYEPVDQDSFDRIINPVGVEPMVQFTVYLRMDYDTGKIER